MKPERMRVVIAEAVGWQQINSTGEHPVGFDPNITVGPAIARLNTVPNFPFCLNAMREAKLALLNTPELKQEFLEIFSQIVPEEVSDLDPVESMWRMTSATALEQCEALIRTLGKWEESCPE